MPDKAAKALLEPDDRLGQGYLHEGVAAFFSTASLRAS